MFLLTFRHTLPMIELWSSSLSLSLRELSSSTLPSFLPPLSVSISIYLHSLFQLSVKRVRDIKGFKSQKRVQCLMFETDFLVKWETRPETWIFKKRNPTRCLWGSHSLVHFFPVKFQSTRLWKSIFGFIAIAVMTRGVELKSRKLKSLVYFWSKCWNDWNEKLMTPSVFSKLEWVSPFFLSFLPSCKGGNDWRKEAELEGKNRNTVNWMRKKIKWSVFTIAIVKQLSTRLFPWKTNSFPFSHFLALNSSPCPWRKE